jgi:lysophospholipase L1-like esterase
MGIGVARQAQANLARALLCVGLGLSTAALGQEPAAPGTTPPALSPTCEAPAPDIATPRPLPHLAAALQGRKTVRVLAIGSSSTAGYGASSPSHSYPAQLEAILERAFKGLDVVIVNRGVSGEVAARTAERLKLQVALAQPDVVLWQVGTNDALARVPLEDFTAAVRETLHWLKQYGIDVVLVGLQYTPALSRDPYYTEIRAALRNLAATESVLLVRRFEAMEFIDRAQEGQLLSGDDLHLNDLGYRCMAEHIARAVVVSAFMRPKLAPPTPSAGAQ